MAFDFSNALDNATTVDNDFSIVNRAGTASTIKTANTEGEWCTEVSSTTSSGTGATTTPVGATGFIYIETSTPVESTTWELKRKISLDGSLNNIFLDFKLNRLCDAGSTFYVEYSEETTPTTWIQKASYAGLTTEAWESITLDFSALNSATVWLRFRVHTLNAYTNDFCVATWREYGTDKNTVIGSTTDSDASLNEINESAPNGSTIGVTALAVDVDVADTVSYSLTDSAVGRFQIDSITGIVTVADTSTIVFANATSHNITMRATSSDGSFTEIISTINVISDAPSAISATTDSNTSVNIINEICIVGDLVGITALATDSNYSDSVSYSLTDNAVGRFQIDSITGVVSVLDPSLIVFADNELHNITVLSSSTDGSTSSKIFTINVEKEISPELAPSLKFNTIKTNGLLTITNGVSANRLNFDCNVLINSQIDITDSVFLRDVSFNTGNGNIVTFDNVRVDGLVYNNDTLNNLPINLTNGSSATAGDLGTGVGQTNIQSVVTIDVNVSDSSQSALDGAFVYIDENINIAGNVFNGTTNIAGNISTVYSGSSTTATLRIRKYGFKPYSGIIDTTKDSSSSVTLVKDPQQI